MEEWLPFVVPVVALYVYGRRSERRRREAVGRLPDPGELDDDTIKRVLASWSAEKHSDILPEHLILLYPPGPDGMTTVELANRVHSEAAAVERLLEQLENLEYLELEGFEDSDGPRVSLTFKGHELVDATEAALLTALEDVVPDQAAGEGPSANSPVPSQATPPGRSA